MKIGILTFHSAYNYGAVLQTYASVCFLKSLGHDVFVLDYENFAITKSYNPLRIERNRVSSEGIKFFLKYPFLVYRRMHRNRAFRHFSGRYLPICDFSFAAEMDLLLVGSDQVWNKRLTGGLDPVYYGMTLPPNIRKISWAASSGKEVLSSEDIATLKRNFEVISVREEQLAKSIPDSILLPDPTMMLSAKEWHVFVRPNKKAYILAYPMLYPDEVMQKARALANEMHLELKVLSPGIKLGSRWIQAASPDRFVSLFCNASYVVTSSFHGAVFTLLFNRPHVFIYHDDPRYDTLLKTDLTMAKVEAESFIRCHFTDK